jgi:cytochrome c2
VTSSTFATLHTTLNIKPRAISLDKRLTDTEALVPDNDMSFHVPKADERADIIRFLKASSGK